MNILLKSVKIVEKGSQYDGQELDILIEKGIITKIEVNIAASDAILIDLPQLAVSTGWCDMRTHGRNPGYESKEDFKSLEAAAIAGGFTDIALLPNTKPIVQSKESVAYIKAMAISSKINYWPIAAATHNCEGNDINELIDLKQAGAQAFSDGELAVSNTDAIIKILQYLSQFNGTFINKSEEAKLNLYGQMHEGLVSNMLGLKGLPAISEEMAIARDLKIIEYLAEINNKFHYHFSTISTAAGVNLMREAKKKFSNVTCDVAIHQLIFNESDLINFETNYKVNPPFRSINDIEMLWNGLSDGTIDAIVSDHCPQDFESKNIEFDLAEFGVIGLETLFSALNTYNNKLRFNQLIDKITFSPRKILGLPTQTIKIGEDANLTLFDFSSNWIYEESKIKSKSKNSPFIGKAMKGKVIGIIAKGELSYA